MASQSHPRAARAPRKRRDRRRFTLAVIRRVTRARWRAFRAVLRTVLASPPTVRALVLSASLLLLWLGINWAYHAVKKPTEVLFPLDHTLNKSPSETWHQYGPLFRQHATAVVTPELLAALAQVESEGTPVARTYWRWQPTWNPLEMYQPASSAVGMYQITDATFQEARPYCVHDHNVVEDGPWHDPRSCWFNSLYTRIVPSHAIELTAARLDRAVLRSMGHRRMAGLSLQKQQDLAAVIHLCGPGVGTAYVVGGFRLIPGQRCGDHDVQDYLARVHAMKRRFARLAAQG